MPARLTLVTLIALALAASPAIAQPPPAGAGDPQAGQGQPYAQQPPQGPPQAGPQAPPRAPPRYVGQQGQRPMPPRRPVRRVNRWRLAVDFALSHYLAIGDRNFGLRNQLGADGIEFENSTGFDFFIGGRSPTIGLELGLRMGFGFGPLNRSAWEQEIDTFLEPSALLNIGASVRWAPLAGRVISPYGGVELLFTQLGTSDSAERTVCDIDGFCIEESVTVPHVKYNGWSFAYLAGVRFSPKRRRWYFYGEGRFVQTTWTNLEIGDAFETVVQPDDVSQMKLNHFSIHIGIGAAL